MKVSFSYELCCASFSLRRNKIVEGYRSSNTPRKADFIAEKLIIWRFNGHFIYLSETKRERKAGKGKVYESQFNQNLFSMGIIKQRKIPCILHS